MAMYWRMLQIYYIYFTFLLIYLYFNKEKLDLSIVLIILIGNFAVTFLCICFAYFREKEKFQRIDEKFKELLRDNSDLIKPTLKKVDSNIKELGNRLEYHLEHRIENKMDSKFEYIIKDIDRRKTLEDETKGNVNSGLMIIQMQSVFSENVRLHNENNSLKQENEKLKGELKRETELNCKLLNKLSNLYPEQDADESEIDEGELD